jgi:hypothetical protein
MNPSTAKQAKASCSVLVGLWSLFWRAILLTPFALVFSVIWLLVWTLLFLLPVCGLYCLWTGDWLSASIATAVCVSLFLLTRSRWFKADRRDFPIDQENV